MSDPANDALMQEAIARYQKGALAEAEALMRHVLAAAPGNGGYWSNLGIVLRRQGKLDETIACYRRAIELMPSLAEAHNNLGNALRDRGDLDGAIVSCQEALRLKPAYADAWNNLGNCLQLRWRLDESVAAYREALKLRPNLPETWNNLGNALKSKGLLDDAIPCFRQAMELRPGYAEAHSSLIYALHYHPGYDAAAQRGELDAWSERHARGLRCNWPERPGDRDPDRRLRIGYVSGDFRGHTHSLLLLPVLRQRDRHAAEIILYSDVLAPDPVTDQWRAQADEWHPVAGMSDEKLAEKIYADRIDILIDLTMHMARTRLRLFARKPAPIQATWLGYPGSTGLSEIDYRISDRYLDPPGTIEGRYTEQTVYLPETFWCYDPLDAQVPVNDLPAAAGGAVTFGCLNNFCKVNEEVLTLWAQVLLRVEASRMIILAPEGDHRERAWEIFAREGIERGRIAFVGYLPRDAYLKVYQRMDIGLDTFPYNGHTTSLDSLWMGVPVVTLVGETVVGRAGLSQLMNLGLPELVAKTPEEYVRIAADLAADVARLAALRLTLRKRMEKSPLMDAGRFARNLEGVYRQMWEQHCAAGGQR